METFCKFSPERGEKSAASNRKSSWLNVLCFYIFGTMSFFYQEMLYTASEDILSGRKLPTSVIIVTFVTPLAAVKLIAPWFIQRISYVFKICFIATFMVAGLVLIIFVNEMHLKMVGIALNALSTGMAEVVFLSLTSFYPQVCISSFVAGTGMASLVSPLYYTGITTWSCVSPKMAIMFTIPLPVLLLIFYALLDKDLITNGNRSGEEHSNVKYTIIGSTSDTHSPDQSVALPEKPPCSEKLRIGLKILPFIIPLFLSFFAEYLSNSSVITSIAFPESHLRPRDHFLFYSLAYRSGKFFGRSYLFIFACLPQDTLEFLSCNKTWVFAVLEMSHLIFFLFESWYHFVSYVWIIIALCSTLGLVAGMIVVHSPHAVSRYVSPEEKEFALGLLTVGNSLGGLVAGFVGLAVEPFLTEKCTQHFSTTREFCFTRHSNTTGWEHNIHC